MRSTSCPTRLRTSALRKRSCCSSSLLTVYCLSAKSKCAGSTGEVARGWTSFTKEVEDKKDKESTVVVSIE
eukprot:3724731-Amphidinium_carterae.1